MSRTVDLDQSKMMREATLGFFVLMLLLGILAFTIYAKATGLFTATPSDQLSPARLVEIDSDGEVILPKPKKDLLVPLPDHESNTIVNLDSMKRISAAQLFGIEEAPVRVAANDEDLPELDSEVLEAIPDRPASESLAITSPQDGNTSSIVSAGSDSVPKALQDPVLPQPKLAAAPLLNAEVKAPNDSAEASRPVVDLNAETTELQAEPPAALPPPSFYQQLSATRTEGSVQASPIEVVVDEQGEDFPHLPNALRANENLPTNPSAPPKSNLSQSDVQDDEAARLGVPEVLESNLASPAGVAAIVEGAAVLPSETNEESKFVTPELPSSLRDTSAPEPLRRNKLAQSSALPSPFPVPRNEGLADKQDLLASDVANSLKDVADVDPASTIQQGSVANTPVDLPMVKPELINEKDVLSERLKMAAEAHLENPSLPETQSPENFDAEQSIEAMTEVSRDRSRQSTSENRVGVEPPSNKLELETQPLVYNQAEIRAALRMVELKTNENLSDVAERIYGSPDWAVALFQLNRQRASSTGQFAVGTQVMFLPVPMMKFLYPDYIPQNKNTVVNSELIGTRNKTAEPQTIQKVEYQEAAETPSRLIYQTRGGETLFGLAAEYLGQASRFTELLELNQSVLNGRWGHLDPLPAGLKLYFPAE